MADSGCLRVRRILVNKAFGDSVLQVLGNKARKNCQIVPVLPMYGGGGGFLDTTQVLCRVRALFLENNLFPPHQLGHESIRRKKTINSVQTRCIVKGEAQKSPLFWRFSGVF